MSGSTGMIDLRYGRRGLSLQYDTNRFEILGEPPSKRPLTDIEIGSRLDDPTGASPIEELVSAGETVLIVVPDATRQAAAGQIVNLLVRRLIANGTAPHEISTIFATGIHRKVTAEEKEQILTPFIAQRIKTIDHDPRDLAQFVQLGETSGGIPISLNKALVEHDHVILVGGITFHYFAGFTGGRKLVCPGLGSTRTISETHRLAFDCETLGRRSGVGIGLLDGNPVHEAFAEVVSKIDNLFAVNTIVNDSGAAVDVHCGDWITSHRAACEAFAAEHTISIREKRQLVVASCGGWPYDCNLIQAHKALESASQACIEGGTIVLLAECPDGTGRHDFLDWFAAADSKALATALCHKYQVNGQTAWSLLGKAERFKVKIVTELDSEVCRKMRLERVDIDEVQAALDGHRSGYLVPYSAKVMIRS